MGNQTPKQENNLWEWISNQNGIDIYRHKEDGRLAEKRRISISQGSMDDEMKIYDFRKQNQVGLVRSYQTIVTNKQNNNNKLTNVCSNQHHYVDVYTQRIVDRLSDLPPLTFPQSIYVLKTTLPAFQLIYKKNGGIHINSELIGFTQKGEAKVWVNENWALNNPSHYIPTLKTLTKRQYYQHLSPQYRDESQMISNLLSVIQDKTENGKFPSHFNDNLKNKPRNFRQIKRQLKKMIDSQPSNSYPSHININKLSLPSSNQQINKSSVLNVTKVGFNNQNVSSSYQPNVINQSYLQTGLYNKQTSNPYPYSLPSYQSNIHMTKPTFQTNTITNYKPISSYQPSHQSYLTNYSLNQPTYNYKPFQYGSTINKSTYLDTSYSNPLNNYLPPLNSKIDKIDIQSDKKYEFKPFGGTNPSESIITNKLVSPLISITKQQIPPQNKQINENRLGGSHHSNNSRHSQHSQHSHHSTTYKIQDKGLSLQANN